MEREYRHTVVLTGTRAFAPPEEASLRTENMAARLQQLAGGRELQPPLPPWARIRPVADGMRIEPGENQTFRIRLPIIMTVMASPDKARSLHQELWGVLQDHFAERMVKQYYPHAEKIVIDQETPNAPPLVDEEIADGP